MKRSEIITIQWECQQALHHLMQHTDNCKWDKVADCYTEDGELFRPSSPNNGIKGRKSILKSLLDRPPRTTCHMLANSVFDIKSSEEVVATSNVWLISGPATEVHPVTADQHMMAGGFTDTLVYVDGKWLIKTRLGSIELKYG